MKTMPINARKRSKSGSRAARALRLSGEVPANLYGAVTEGDQTKLITENLAVSAYDITQLINAQAQVLEVSYDGNKELVQLTEVQRDAFGDSILHIDLRMIDPNKPMQSQVSIVFKGEAVGTKTGGSVQIALHRLDIEALPRKTPREIVLDISELDINQSIHVNEMTLPEGVTATTNEHQLVVQVVPPAAEEEATAEDGEGGAAEPEVISKGKQDDE